MAYRRSPQRNIVIAGPDSKGCREVARLVSMRMQRQFIDMQQPDPALLSLKSRLLSFSSMRDDTDIVEKLRQTLPGRRRMVMLLDSETCDNEELLENLHSTSYLVKLSCEGIKPAEDGFGFLESSTVNGKGAPVTDSDAFTELADLVIFRRISGISYNARLIVHCFHT